jgi:predicted metal-dependent HD superfamily phosphohydrolase
MIDWLKTEWNSLASKYCEDQQLIDRFWQEIVLAYTEKKRYYHNASHIYNMLLQVEEIKYSIIDFDALRFAIWYHDIIYKSTKSDNEEESAVFAKKRLKSFNIEEKRLKTISDLIISTKKHQVLCFENEDNGYLLDLDLSILGTDEDVYKTYCNNIRKEYSIYPDLMYNKGRKKVLKQFLERETLYFSKYFKSQFEVRARKNVTKELYSL